ncbi:Gfo/Idh/MocA family protein [Granulicella cerasi]|uniref:Gfo/Idh/MocA family protein n=1 Tax=Granulicella cerasi TaxID=741063 RepID=UPI0021DF9C3E|nr:Gfo/Idh/MocA family oxidoreductase [Granulicella cerasi]
METNHRTRIAVIGAGAFGRNHLRVYRELEASTDVQLTAVVDASPEIRTAAAAQYSIPAFATVEELLAARLDLDAASVCVPTIHHAAVAQQLLAAGLDVLIEKPFAATLEEAEQTLAIARAHDRIVQIGHLERFNPAVTATLENLTQPMFFEAHRLSLFTPRSLDVDVVLDLMIHDLDIVLALARSEVASVHATGIPILSRKTDIANVRVEFHSGAVANFTASRVSTEQVRKLRLFQPHQYLSLDFARQELLTISVDPALAEQISNGYRPPATVPANHPTTGFDLQKLDLPRAEPLRLELEDFLASIRTRQQPRVPGEAGLAALALALRINAEIAAHHQRAGL